MRKLCWCCCCLLFCLPGNSFAKGLRVQLSHYVGSKPLQLDTGSYKNGLQQSYIITGLKYYIGQFHFMNDQGKEITDSSYFLVNAADSASMELAFDRLPAGNYTGISFIIGVDSIHNCSGAQSGALDPVNGMFWAWNTGYIFMKLEGKAPVVTSAGHVFEYHIGGYRAGNNCIRKVVLNKKVATSLYDRADFRIKVDLADFFSTPAVIDFAALPVVTDAVHATEIADHYQHMFSLMP